MLLERNRVVIGSLFMAIIAAGAIFAVGVTGGLFVAGDPMEAVFEDAAGLKPRDFVYVGGSPAGEVTSVDVDGEVVRIGFSVTAPELPADSEAHIIIVNTLGKRGLAIVPPPGTARTSTDVLERDSVIPLERTRTPVDLPDLGDRTAELLGTVDVDALQALTTALADITDGARDDVVALLEGVEDVTRVVVDRRDELQTVIDRATVLVDAAASKDAELVRIIDDFGAVLERLVARRDDITRLLQETAASSTVTADLVEERRAQIDRVLASLTEDLAVVDQHQVDLAHFLAQVGNALVGYSSIGYIAGDARVDAPGWANQFVTGIGTLGIGALMDCGGALDEAFSDLLGPDPRCEDLDNPTIGDGPPAEEESGSLPGLGLGDLLDPITSPADTSLSVARFLGLPDGPFGSEPGSAR